MKLKLIIFKNLFNKNHQSGVTLLLSIIILSAIMAISFSVATILFAEIRNSGDLLRSEPVITAATSIAEESFFKVKRSVPDSLLTYSTKIGGVSISPPVENVFNDPILLDKVLKDSISFTSTPNRYYLFDPSNAQGGSGYGKIQITNIESGNSDNLQVYICEYDPANTNSGGASPVCSDPSPANSYWLVNAAPVTPNTPAANRTWLLDPTKQQQLILVNNGGTGTIYTQIATFGASPSYTLRGMPFFGEKAVDITASMGGVSRKIKVKVPSSSVSSPNSSSVSFDGAAASRVSAPNIAAYNISNFTMEAWVYPQRLNYGVLQTIVDKQSAGRNFGLFITQGTSKVYYSFQAADCSTWRSYDSTGSLSLNSWNHVSATYDGNNFNLYINGALDSSQAITSTVCVSADPIFIGNDYFNSTPLLGFVDDVRIWNLPRTAAQISTYYNQQLAGSETGLVGYWKFNEGLGATGADSTSNSNPATLNGGASWTTNTPFP